MLFASVLVTRWLFGPRSALANVVAAMPARMALDGVAIGAVIGLLIISPLGRSSGGHFNPAVTVTLWLLRGLPGRDATAYVAAQLAGSLGGVALARAMLGVVIAGADGRLRGHPPRGRMARRSGLRRRGNLADGPDGIRGRVPGPALAVAVDPAVVATGVAVLIFAGGLTSGGSFNPARQLGPLLFAGRFSYLWAYLLGPLAGAVILIVLVRALGLPQPLTCDLCRTPPREAPSRPHPPPNRRWLNRGKREAC